MNGSRTKKRPARAVKAGLAIAALSLIAIAAVAPPAAAGWPNKVSVKDDIDDSCASIGGPWAGFWFLVAYPAGSPYAKNDHDNDGLVCILHLP